MAAGDHFELRLTYMAAAKRMHLRLNYLQTAGAASEFTCSRLASAFREDVLPSLMNLWNQGIDPLTIYVRKTFGDGSIPFLMILDAPFNADEELVPLVSTIILTGYATNGPNLHRASYRISGCPEAFQKNGVLNNIGLALSSVLGGKIVQAIAWSGDPGLVFEAGVWVGGDDIFPFENVQVRSNLHSQKTRVVYPGINP